MSDSPCRPVEPGFGVVLAGHGFADDLDSQVAAELPLRSDGYGLLLGFTLQGARITVFVPSAQHLRRRLASRSLAAFDVTADPDVLVRDGWPGDWGLAHPPMPPMSRRGWAELRDVLHGALASRGVTNTGVIRSVEDRIARDMGVTRAVRRGTRP